MHSIRDVNKSKKGVHKRHNSSIKYEEFKDTHSNKRLLDTK